MVFDVTGSVWGDTGCNLLVLGQYNLVLIGIELYWVNKGLLCLYILKKLMVTPTDQPTDQPTGIPDNCHFFYTDTILGAEILHRKNA